MAGIKWKNANHSPSELCVASCGGFEFKIILSRSVGWVGLSEKNANLSPAELAAASHCWAGMSLAKIAPIDQACYAFLHFNCF